jgi:hypothetical protein
MYTDKPSVKGMYTDKPSVKGMYTDKPSVEGMYTDTEKIQWNNQSSKTNRTPGTVIMYIKHQELL